MGNGKLGRLLALSVCTGCYGGASADSEGATDGASDGSGDESGSSGDETGSGEGGDVEGFECAPDAWPDSLSMRRLSLVQYRNTVQSLVTWASQDDTGAVFAQVEPMLERVPVDVRQAPHNAVRGGFRRLDQDVHQEHIDGTYDVAIAAARVLTEDHLSTVAGSCAVDDDSGNDEACITDFIQSFGTRALRRPLTADESTFYRSVFDAQGVTVGMEPEAFADVIAVMMTAPSFVYLVEHGTDPVQGRDDVFALGSYELAQRLSYQFWQAPPDQELLDAAADGSLLDPDAYAEQVDRLLDDPRAGAAVEEFFGEWLWLEDLPPIDARLGTPVYDAFLGDFEVLPETTQNMTDEVRAMATYYVRQGGSFRDFFTSDRSFASTPDLAEIYGVPMWTGGDPPAFPQGERAGLLARAAFVSTGTANTRPIMKGVRVREALLCDELDPPPDNAAGDPPELSPDQTTREVVEALTEQPGSSCASCHLTQINPLGFVTENFDGIGRYRTEQTLFDEDGNELGARPVDTSSTPYVVPGDDTQISSAGELSDMLLGSQKVQSCFARNYVRWTFGRAEDEESDGCILGETTAEITDDASLRDVLRSMALREEFRTRKFEETE